MADSKKISVLLDGDLLSQVNDEAERADQPVSVWIRGSIHNRLRGPIGGKINHHSYAKAVAAAQSASRGKLNRVDAEAVASRVITTIAND